MRTQNSVKDNTGNSLKTMVQTKSKHHKHEDLNLMFANHGKEDGIYHLTTIEIAKAHKKDH
jgi:hypothetical protein